MSFDHLTVRDLLDAGELQLTQLAGQSGLDRPVRWTHVSELENPAVWLEGGELLLTNGLGIPAEAGGQRELIAALEERRAAGLAIGARGPALAPAALELADERGFPLLSIPLEVPFLAIARFVADANQAGAQRRLQTHVRIFDTLRPGEQPTDPASVFERLEAISGYHLFLTSVIGAPLIRGFRAPPSEVVEAIGGADFRPHSSNPAVPGGFAVPVPLEQRPDTFLIAIEDPRARAPAGLGAVRHMATIAALQLSGLYHERETQRRRATEALAKLAAGSSDPQTAEETMRALGLDLSASTVVLAVSAADDHAMPDEIHHRLADFGVAHAMVSEDHTYFEVAAEPDVLDAVVRGLEVRAGASRRRHGLRGWAIARKEAQWALGWAVNDDGPRGVVRRFAQAESAIHWLPSDIATLQNLVDEILSPVIEYDVRHGSALVHSLRVYFAHDRRLHRAAEQLIVHSNTLSYRLNRIEQITGRDLGSLSDVVQLWLALQAHEIVGEDAAPD